MSNLMVILLKTRWANLDSSINVFKEEPYQFMDRSAKTGHRFFKNDTSAYRSINLGS